MDGADIDVESQRLIEQLLRAEADDRASRLVAERIQLDHVLRATQNPAADVIIHEPKPQDDGAASPRPPQDKAPAATVAVAAAERPPASEASRPRRRQTQRPTATNGSTQRKSLARQRADPAPAPSRVRERCAVQNAPATAPRMVDGAIIISDSEDESADRRSPPATGQRPGKQKQKQKQPASQQPSAALAASRKTKPRRKRVLVISSDEEDGDGPAVAPVNAVVQEVAKDDVQPPPPTPPVDDTLNNAVDTGSLQLPLPDTVVGPDVEMDGVDKEREAEQTPLDANVDHTDLTSQSKAAGKRRAEEQPPGHERAKRARSRHPIDASRSTPGASRRSRTVDPNRSSRARRPGGDASAKRSRAPPPAEPAQAICGICRDEFRITRNPIFESLRPGSSSTLPPGLRLPCPGRHAYCLTCIQTVVRNKLEPENKDPSLVAFPIFCPECPRAKWPDGIPFNVAERILDLKDQQLWKSRRRMIHRTRTMWCPNPRCSQQVEADEALVKPNALCPACKEIMCVRCRVRWHKGMTCEEYQALPLTERAPEDAATILLANAEKWKQCPHCKMLVELTAGCNHMICRCGAHFCIKCAGKWDRNRGLCSQGCMLWDEEMILRVQEERAQAARVGPPGPAAGPAAGEPADENVSHAQKLIPAPYELPKPLHLDYLGARRPPRPPPPPPLPLPPAPPAQPQPRRDMPKKAPRAVFNPLVAAAESLLAQTAKLDGFLQQLGLRPPVQSRPLPLVYDYEDNYGDDGDGEDEDGDDEDDDGYDDNGEDLEWLFDEDAVSDQHWFTTNMLDEPFTCGYCEEDTYSLERLQQHLLATEDHGVWACCGKFFQREIDLDRHQEAYPARFHRHVLKVCWDD